MLGFCIQPTRLDPGLVAQGWGFFPPRQRLWLHRAPPGGSICESELFAPPMLSKGRRFSGRSQSKLWQLRSPRKAWGGCEGGSPVPACVDMTWDESLLFLILGPPPPPPIERRKGLRGLSGPRHSRHHPIQISLPTALARKPPPSLRPPEPLGPTLCHLVFEPPLTIIPTALF